MYGPLAGLGADEADDAARRALRGQVNQDLAVLMGVSTSSIRTGPAWMWSGTFHAPLRANDISPRLMDKIETRRSAVPGERWRDAPGPRHYRLPAPALRAAHRWTWWLGGAALAAGAAAAAPAAGVRYIAAALAITLLAVAVAGLAVAGVDISDPRRLTARDRSELDAAAVRRTVTWTPLANSAAVSTGAGYVLYAHDLLEQARAHAALQDAMFTVALGRESAPLDEDEELLLMARAGERLDRLDWTIAQHAGEQWPDDVGRRVAAEQERELLDATMRRRVTALRRYVNELDAAAEQLESLRRRRRAASDDDEAMLALTEAEMTEFDIIAAGDRVLAASRAVRDVATPV